MSFSYQFGANPQIDYIRMLISDTQCTDHIFEDSEILAAYNIQAAQFQSSMLYSGTMGASLPSQPVSYLRVAALLMDCLASDKARLGGVTKLLDVSLGQEKIAVNLRAQAAAWREVDDNSGAFMIIEQCSTTWSFQDRWIRQIQRQFAV